MSYSSHVSGVFTALGLLMVGPAAATLTITGVTCSSATSSVDASGNVTVTCVPTSVTPPPSTPTAPGAPNISSITPASPTSLSIAFVPNAATPGTPPVSYSATCGTGGATSGSGTSGGGSQSPLSVSGLSASTTYSCVVTATNNEGSATSTAAQGITSATSSGACAGSGGVGWTNFTSPGLTVAGTLSGGASSNTQSYSFVMGKGTFPTGVKILLNVSGSYSNPRDHFISSCPDDFTNPPAGNTVANCQRSNAKVGAIYLGYTDDPATQLSYSCNLVPGQTYYLNMRTVYNSSQGAYLSSGYLLNTNGR